MSDTGDIWMVYKRGLRGPTPQTFPAAAGKEPQLDSHTTHYLLHKVRIEQEHHGMSLVSLTRLYPCPAHFYADAAS